VPSGGQHSHSRRALYFEAVIATGMWKRGLGEMVGDVKTARKSFAVAFGEIQGDAGKMYDRMVEASNKAKDRAVADYNRTADAAQLAYAKASDKAEESATKSAASSTRKADKYVADREREAKSAQASANAAADAQIAADEKANLKLRDDATKTANKQIAEWDRVLNTEKRSVVQQEALYGRAVTRQGTAETASSAADAAAVALRARPSAAGYSPNPELLAEARQRLAMEEKNADALERQLTAVNARAHTTQEVAGVENAITDNENRRIKAFGDIARYSDATYHSSALWSSELAKADALAQRLYARAATAGGAAQAAKAELDARRAAFAETQKLVLQAKADIEAARQAELLDLEKILDAEKASRRSAAAYEMQWIGAVRDYAVRQRQEELAATLASLDAQKAAAEAAARKEGEASLAAAEAARVAAMAQADIGLKSAEAAASVERLGAGFKGMFQMLASGIPILGMGIGLFGALALAEEHMVSTVMDYSAALERNAKVLDMNQQDLDLWIQMGLRVGITQEATIRSLAKLNRSLIEHSALLKEIGVNAKGPAEAMLQLADAFSQATNKQKVLDAAQLLFASGGGGGQTYEKYVKILELSRPTLEAIKKEFIDLGVILSDSERHMLAAADAAKSHLGLELEGLKNKLSADLAPTFGAVFNALYNILFKNEGLIKNIAKSISDIMAYMVGALAGLTDTPLKDIQKQTGDAAGGLKTVEDAVTAAGDAVDTATIKQTKANAAAEDHRVALDAQRLALDKLKASISDQTQALDDQVKALQDVNTEGTKAVQDSSNAQVKAIQDVVNEQEQQWQQDQKMLQIQDDLHQSVLVQLQDQLDLLQDTTARRRGASENLLAYETRLHELDLQEQIKVEQNKRKLATDTGQLAIDKAKQTAQDQIQLLQENTKTQLDQMKKVTDTQVESLTKQKNDLNRYIQDKEQAYSIMAASINLADQKAALAAKRVLDQSNADLQAAQDKAGMIIGDFDATMIQRGKDDMTRFKNWMIEFWNDPGGAILDAVKGFAGAIGEALASGVGDPLAKEMVSILGSQATQMMTGKIATGISADIHKTTNPVELVNIMKRVNDLTQAEVLSNEDSTMLLAAINQQLQAFRQQANKAQQTEWYRQYGVQFDQGGNPITGTGSIPNVFGGSTPYGVDVLGPGAKYGPQQPAAKAPPGAGFAEGGVINRPGWIFAGEGHRKEAIIPLSNPGRAVELMRQTGLGTLAQAAGGGTTLTANYYGPVADSLVASRVVGRMATEARRRNLMNIGSRA
jgi:hypothetical protein